MVPKDENNVPVVNPAFSLKAEKTITFAGGTPNAIGDHDGTSDPFPIFTVTGTVLLRILAVCETALEGASATIAVGTAATPAGLIASTTATNIIANEIWHDATPDASIELSSVLTEKVVSDDVIGSIATANITAGKIKFVALWYPITKDGNVTAA